MTYLTKKMTVTDVKTRLSHEYGVKANGRVVCQQCQQPVVFTTLQPGLIYDPALGLFIVEMPFSCACGHVGSFPLIPLLLQEA